MAPDIGFGAHWSWVWLGRAGSPGEDVPGQGFDVVWCSVRSKVCFGDDARTGRAAGRQRRMMTVFFTVSFLKDQIEAPG